jgi:hypothetical protein
MASPYVAGLSMSCLQRLPIGIDEMRREYDFSSGVRGKYLPRLAKGANVVVLDRDMAKVFPTSKAVNDALRVLAEAGRRHGKAKGSTRGV